MKKQFIFLWLAFFTVPALFAQHLDFQAGSEQMDSKSLFEKVSKMEKKTDKINLFLNMQGSFDVNFTEDRLDQAAFRMDQLRVELKGNLTDRIYYRYRQRLNRAANALSLDNMPASIDYAAVGFHVTDQFSVFAGKQSTCFGGFEFDLNPVDVYQYCDMLDYMNNFLTGVDFSYWLNNNHEVRFQVLDSRNGSFSEMYGEVPEGIKQAKTPLGYTLNWNGSFFDNLLKTRWSASIFHETIHRNWYYYALGTEVNLQKFHMFFDFMYSKEQIDRTGIISEIARNNEYDVRALDTRYLSLVAHLNYRVTPKWNLFIKGMYETARVQKTNQTFEKGKYRTSWGYLSGVEYYPTEENLHFFLNYIGRTYDYTNLARTYGVGNSSPQRVELGFIYVLPLF